MKLIHLLVVVVFLGISASVALADGVPTDPVLLTSGCGRVGQPKCDAYLITSPNVALTITLTPDLNEDQLSGDLVASFINVSGSTLTPGFTVDFVVPAGLSFQGCGSNEGVTLLFTCTGGGSSDSPITGGGTAVFTLTGATLCSVDSDDVVTSNSPGGFALQADEDSDDNCQSSFTLALQPVAGETLPQSITGFITTPEPSSSVLLLFGLAVGLLTLKGLRANLA